MSTIKTKFGVGDLVADASNPSKRRQVVKIDVSVTGETTAIMYATAPYDRPDYNRWYVEDDLIPYVESKTYEVRVKITPGVAFIERDGNEKDIVEKDLAEILGAMALGNRYSVEIGDLRPVENLSDVINKFFDEYVGGKVLREDKPQKLIGEFFGDPVKYDLKHFIINKPGNTTV